MGEARTADSETQLLRSPGAARVAVLDTFKWRWWEYCSQRTSRAWGAEYVLGGRCMADSNTAVLPLSCCCWPAAC